MTFDLFLTDTALKVSRSLYCFTTSISHGVESYFHRLWGTGIYFCARCPQKGKGNDPCVAKQYNTFCNILPSDQRARLATPSYKLKKEKRDLKERSDNSEAVIDTCSSLMDSALVSEMGVVEGQGTVKSPGKSVTKEKKKVASSHGNTTSSASKLAMLSESKLGFNVPFNSQGHIGTGPQHCHLWDSNPQM